MNRKEEIAVQKIHRSSYWIFGIVFLCVSCVLFWKCRYGYAHLDEAFYLTIPYRFLQGDKILFEEWNNTQLSAFPVLPIIWGFIKARGGTTGIYLFIRYLYTVLKCVLSLLIFNQLKRFHVISAMAASISFLVYSCYGMMVLSYNSMAIGGLLCAVLLLLTDAGKIGNRVSFFFAGVCLSIAVLNLPHLAGLYVLYIVCVIIFAKKEVSNAIIRSYFSVSAAIWMTAGVFAMVLAFCWYVFSHTSFAEILQTIPAILLGDPDHPPKVLWKIIPGYFARIVLGNEDNYWTFALYALFGVEALCILLDARRMQRKTAYLMAAAALTIGMLLAYFITDSYVNHIFFVPNVIAVIIYLLSEDKTVKGLFWCIWLPGMIYSFFQYNASNTGFSGISGAASVATIGSVMIIGLELFASLQGRRIAACLLSAVLVLTVGITFYYRVTYIFWENSVSEQTEQITEGPQAGLLVTEERYEYYYGIMKDTEEIRGSAADTHVLYISDKSLWLAGPQRCASYSPLSYGITGSRNILESYYEVHPDKKADMIYVDFTFGEDIAEELSQKLNMKMERKACGYILK